MSLAPMVPGGMGANIKSFWKRPEGLTGALILLGVVGVVGWTWGTILPFIVSMFVDTLHALALACGIGAILWVLFSKKSHLVFRLISRWLTGLLINLDPLGIRRDNLLQAKKKQEELNSQVGNVRGSVQTLDDTLEKNKKTIEKDLGIAEEGKRRMGAAKDPAEKLRWQYEVQLRMNEIGRMQRSNETYQGLRKTIKDLYDKLVRFSAGIDFFIADLEGSIKEEEVKNKTIKSAWSAFSTAMSIIRGSADEQDIYDRAAEVLVEQDNMRLGQIEDFMRLSQHFLDSVDLENGVVDAKATQALNSYEQKLLTSGDQGTVALITGGGSVLEKEAVPVARISKDDWFK